MEVVKMGHYYTKSGEKRQRYKCKGCGRTFVLNPIKPRNYPEGFKEMVFRAVVKEGVGIRYKQRIVKRGGTNHIERLFLTLRNDNPRFARKTLRFSKSLQMLENSIKLWIHYHNSYTLR